MLFHLLDQSNQMTIEMGEILYHAKEDMSSTTWRMPEEEKAEAEKAEEECAVETEAQEQKLEVPTAEETREAETDKQLEAFAAQLRELQRQLGNSGRKIKNRRKRTKKKNRNFAFAWTMKNARRNRPEKSRGARKPDVRS